MKNAILFFTAAIFCAAVFSGCGREAAQKDPAAAAIEREQIVQAARDAYIYGFPLVLNEMTKRFMTNPLPASGNAPVNQIRHFRSFADDKFNYFIRPNADMFYSFAWLDVSKEPMLLEIPETGTRYALFTLFDGWSDVLASFGTRLGGGAALKVAVTGPAWEGTLPEGFTEYRSDTDTVWLKGMIEVKGKQDGETAVKKIQDGIKLYPLSAYGAGHDAPKAKAGGALQLNTPLEQVLSMNVSDFFNALNRLMMKNPPRVQDAKMLDRALDLGVAPGMRFDVTIFDFDTQEALRGVPAWAKRYMESMKNEGADKGWIYNYGLGDYKTDYVFRAKTSYYIPAADNDEDLLHIFSYFDADNELFGAAKNYVLHFDKEQLPPVNAVWSLSAYDGSGFFAQNTGRRYSIGGKDKLAFNKDGSLDIYIQKANPGKNKQSNWLPVSGSGFSLALRCYWPKKTLTDAGWKVPAVEKAR